MPEYKLLYFNLRARGEVARQLFALAGQPYEDARVEFADWPEFKKSMPFAQLPVLFVDGKPIPQSITIARYLARQFGFAGKTLLEQALVDSIADQFTDFYREARPFFITLGGFVPGKWEDLIEPVLRKARDGFLPLVTKFLRDSKSGFLVGDSVTYVDLILAEHVSTAKVYDSEYVKNYPEVQAHWAKVRAIPNLKKWIEERPKTIY